MRHIQRAVRRSDCREKACHIRWTPARHRARAPVGRVTRRRFETTSDRASRAGRQGDAAPGCATSWRSDRSRPVPTCTLSPSAASSTICARSDRETLRPRASRASSLRSSSVSLISTEGRITMSSRIDPLNYTNFAYGTLEPAASLPSLPLAEGAGEGLLSGRRPRGPLPGLYARGRGGVVRPNPAEGREMDAAGRQGRLAGVGSRTGSCFRPGRRRRIMTSHDIS